MKIKLIVGVMLMLQACAVPKTKLINDPAVVAIPVVDSKEAFMDLRDQDIIAFGPSPETPNNQDYTKVRKSVYEKLIQAQELLPKDLKFCLYEGYRSLVLQEQLFIDRYQEIMKRRTFWNDEEIFNETTKMVSPVINFDGSVNLPPHSTGAAIDIYLVYAATDEPVDMGILVQDWKDDMDGSLSATDSLSITKKAQDKRKIMSDALTQVGFVNDPSKYWRWSYGDRYWAYCKGENHAIYGGLRK
jgi:D-alanyl-D-alanine dipeptidase